MGISHWLLEKMCVWVTAPVACRPCLLKQKERGLQFTPDGGATASRRWKAPLVSAMCLDRQIVSLSFAKQTSIPDTFPVKDSCTPARYTLPRPELILWAGWVKSLEGQALASWHMLTSSHGCPVNFFSCLHFFLQEKSQNMEGNNAFFLPSPIL